MNLENVYVVVVGKPYKQLTNWLKANDLEFRVYCHAYEPAIARNEAIIDFLETGFRSLMMFDGDQIPIEETKKIIGRVEEPLVYCGYPSRNVKHKGHFGDGDFAAGCFRCDREVILTMKEKLDVINKKLVNDDFHFSQPLELGWFGRAMSNYGSIETTCSCDWFRNLAKSVGYEAKMIGVIGHALNESDTIFLTEEYTSYAKCEQFSSLKMISCV